jgi:hypothetical protein
VNVQPVDNQPAAFDLGNQRAYRQWRDDRLRVRPHDAHELRSEIDDPERLTRREVSGIRTSLARGNLAIYAAARPLDEQAVIALCGRLGLHRLDRHYLAPSSGVARLHQASGGRGEFVPYTSRALNWHTDGYYNPTPQAVRCFALHCLAPAARGGGNRFFDHELAYIRLRDREPRWIEALSRPDALCIPAHYEAGRERRAAVAGPVFFVDGDGRLRMRFTMRTRHVQWAHDSALHDAREYLQELLVDSGEDIQEYRLAAGEGVVCNNTLHCREAYNDDPASSQRTFLRARYVDAPFAGQSCFRLTENGADVLARP